MRVPKPSWGSARWGRVPVALGALTAALALAGPLAVAQPAIAATAAWAFYSTSIDSPTGVAAGPHGRMWYSTNNNGIVSLDLGGRSKVYRTRAETDSIAALPSGVVYATEGVGGHANRLIRVSTGGRVEEIALPTSAAAAGMMMAGPDGDGWFVEGNDNGTVNNVGRVTPAGQVNEFPLPDVVGFDGFTFPASPAAVASGPNGTVWVAVDGGVDVLNPAGAIVRTIRFPATGYGVAAQLAVARDGSAWIATTYSFVVEVAPDGVVSKVSMPPGWTSDAVARGPDGNVYVASNGYSGVWRATTPGALIALPFTVHQLIGTSWQRDGLSPTGAIPMAPGPGGTLWMSADLQPVVGGGVISAPVTVDLQGRCIVPNISNEPLGQVHRDLADHRCSLGHVHYRSRNDPAVVCQRPRPGAVWPPWSPVRVTVDSFVNVIPPSERRNC